MSSGLSRDYREEQFVVVMTIEEYERSGGEEWRSSGPEERESKRKQVRSA
jgi:hypothetical protein